MAIATMGTFLMHSDTGAAGSYEKLIDIVSYPDMGGQPGTIDTTTLSNTMMTNILALAEGSLLAFPANFSAADFAKVKTLEKANKDEYWALWFGGTDNGDGTMTPTGENGCLTWQGKVKARVTSGEVNNKVGMEVDISTSTPIAFSEKPATA